MIINNTFGFIFVHVPKAAGTTVSNLLSRATCYCDIEVGGSPLGEAIQPHYRQRFGLAKHSTAREIRAVVGEVTWKRSFTIGFVRNPYARAQSAYKFMKSMRLTRRLPVLEPLDRLDTFPDFVRSDFFASEGMDRILRPQIFWLRGEHSDSSAIVDFVGKVESISESMQLIARAIPSVQKFLDVTDVPRLNQSPDSAVVADDWAGWAMDPQIEAKVFERYKVDFSAFGYPRFDAAHRSS